jgi:hypothetical protein
LVSGMRISAFSGDTSAATQELINRVHSALQMSLSLPHLLRISPGAEDAPPAVLTAAQYWAMTPFSRWLRPRSRVSWRAV